MSTSILCHGFGIADQQYMKTVDEQGNVIFGSSAKGGG